MIDWLISIANYDALQLLSSVVLQRSSREDFWTCLSAAVGTTYVTTPAHPPCPHTLPILDILLPLADEPQPSRSAVCRAMDEHRLQVRTFICMGAAFSLFLCLQVPFLRVISFPLFLLLSFLSHFHASAAKRPSLTTPSTVGRCYSTSTSGVREVRICGENAFIVHFQFKISLLSDDNSFEITL